LKDVDFYRVKAKKEAYHNNKENYSIAKFIEEAIRAIYYCRYISSKSNYFTN
jgi:hypothetical protein